MASLLARFFGRTASEGAAFALGAATGPVLAPPVEELRQAAWQQYPTRALDPGTLASGVSQGQVDAKWAEGEAARHGVNSTRFQRLVDIANVGPGMAAAFDLWRRGVISPERFKAALKRNGIEQEWIDDLVKVKQVLLSPSEVANAVQQGHLPNDGILPDISAAVAPAEGAVAPDTPDGQPPSSVPLTQIDLKPEDEASGHGIDLDRLKVLANLAGLPPGAETVLAMWNRGLIDEETVDAGIREGHLKTKWAGAFKRMRWNVLSGQEYAEAHLRDWISLKEMYAGGALTGHTKSQMDLFYKNRGRTATPRQLWLAIARKVKAPNYPDLPSGGRLTDFSDHERAIRRSNIQPWYAQLLFDIRWNYPPLFQLNRLVQAGAIDSDTAALWASYNLEAPEVIDALKKYWNSLGTGTAAVDQREKLATTQAIATLKKRFIEEKIDGAGVLQGLELLGVSVGSAGRILETWTVEQGWTEKLLSPAQIKKAYGSNLLTQDEAVAALVQQHFAESDARTFLAS